jgi:pimeloyl-ACP methyl ester carboxylesterase
MIDSVVRDVAEEEMAVRRARAVKRHRVYPTAEEAYARFHTIPETTYAAPELLRHIAEESLTSVPGGWAWKFDMNVFGQQTPSPTSLVPLACPVKLVRGAEGLVDAEMGSVIARGLGCAPPEVVEHCGHHVLLDRPEETVRILRDALTDWQVR